VARYLKRWRRKEWREYERNWLKLRAAGLRARRKADEWHDTLDCPLCGARIDDFTVLGEWISAVCEVCGYAWRVSFERLHRVWRGGGAA
jgi:rubredoxin